MADDIPSRVAALEQAFRDIQATIAEIRAELREMRGEFRGELRELRAEMNRDRRWFVLLYLAGMGALLGAMAHGFHWL
jgi:hypothetical protein